MDQYRSRRWKCDQFTGYEPVQKKSNEELVVSESNTVVYPENEIIYNQSQ